MRRVALLLLLLAACSDPQAYKEPSCADLPTCSTPEPAENAYGQGCGFTVPGGPYANWRGLPVCCLEDVIYAACVSRGYGGNACDPDQPLSCDVGMTCGADPSCSAPCCR
jgi:hypothetical protein